MNNKKSDLMKWWESDSNWTKALKLHFDRKNKSFSVIAQTCGTPDDNEIDLYINYNIGNAHFSRIIPCPNTVAELRTSMLQFADDFLKVEQIREDIELEIRMYQKDGKLEVL